MLLLNVDNIVKVDMFFIHRFQQVEKKLDPRPACSLESKAPVVPSRRFRYRGLSGLLPTIIITIIILPGCLQTRGHSGSC